MEKTSKDQALQDAEIIVKQVYELFSINQNILTILNILNIFSIVNIVENRNK
jgi:hypothetical protein